MAWMLKEKGIYEFVEAARNFHRTAPQVCFQLLGDPDDLDAFADLLGRLLRHQPETQLGRGACRDDGLGAFALIPRRQAADVVGRPGPASLQGRPETATVRRAGA